MQDIGKQLSRYNALLLEEQASDACCGGGAAFSRPSLDMDSLRAAVLEVCGDRESAYAPARALVENAPCVVSAAFVCGTVLSGLWVL